MNLLRSVLGPSISASPCPFSNPDFPVSLYDCPSSCALFACCGPPSSICSLLPPIPTPLHLPHQTDPEKENQRVQDQGKGPRKSKRKQKQKRVHEFIPPNWSSPDLCLCNMIARSLAALLACLLLSFNMLGEKPREKIKQNEGNSNTLAMSLPPTNL